MWTAKGVPPNVRLPTFGNQCHDGALAASSRAPASRACDGSIFHWSQGSSFCIPTTTMSLPAGNWGNRLSLSLTASWSFYCCPQGRERDVSALPPAGPADGGASQAWRRTRDAHGPGSQGRRSGAAQAHGRRGTVQAPARAGNCAGIRAQVCSLLGMPCLWIQKAGFECLLPQLGEGSHEVP